jgi:hypothetical protein
VDCAKFLQVKVGKKPAVKATKTKGSTGKK